MLKKQDIRALTKEDIAAFLKENGQAAFRAKQVWEWLWQKSARSFDEMSNLSKDLRLLLNEHFAINTVSIDDIQVSGDRTIKCAMKLFDDKVVESVLIPTTSRMTVCISTQVGCSLTCKFCATGRLERLRNLSAGEIYDQVVLVNKLATEKYNQHLSNIVYMGMGEPLLNYTETIRSVDRICSPDGLNMSPQRITVSTAGIAKMIKKLGDDKVKFNLALSLHAANDAKRNKIMPINESNSLENLAEALNYFYEKTGTRVTFEYIAFKDFNDSIADADELAAFCKKVPAKVNIIEYNPIDKGEFMQTTLERLMAFKDRLEQKGIIVNIRRSRGKDIDAACGQLANKNKSTKPILK
ncbi:MAG TPA: 23S rRNA (adenine(2503)-C(2))-methyltransferase RlmN [Bacteroidia bacterium]|jgi:23S rRNA (adenine2503-C2)-methyltransferase|nr:23S rRNA (adenine(2503)-C(2))-methyltransferase RlmN [Bacteroidia bacterium]